MNARMLALFSGGTSVALLVLFAIWKAQYCRAQKRKDADDVVRWEGEGGAAPPDVSSPLDGTVRT